MTNSWCTMGNGPCHSSPPYTGDSLQRSYASFACELCWHVQLLQCCKILLLRVSVIETESDHHSRVLAKFETLCPTALDSGDAEHCTSRGGTCICNIASILDAVSSYTIGRSTPQRVHQGWVVCERIQLLPRTPFPGHRILSHATIRSWADQLSLLSLRAAFHMRFRTCSACSLSRGKPVPKHRQKDRFFVSGWEL